MSDIEREILNVQVSEMDKKDLKNLCKQIPSWYLINEIGQRLLRFEKHTGEAKESLEKVV